MMKKLITGIVTAAAISLTPQAIAEDRAHGIEMVVQKSFLTLGPDAVASICYSLTDDIPEMPTIDLAVKLTAAATNELIAAVKNVDSDYVGFSHNRRLLYGGLTKKEDFNALTPYEEGEDGLTLMLTADSYTLNVRQLELAKDLSPEKAVGRCASENPIKMPAEMQRQFENTWAPE